MNTVRCPHCGASQEVPGWRRNATIVSHLRDKHPTEYEKAYWLAKKIATLSSALSTITGGMNDYTLFIPKENKA